MSEESIRQSIPVGTPVTMLAGAVDAITQYKPSYRTAAGWVCVAALAQVFVLTDWENFVLQMYSLSSGRSVPTMARLSESYTLELIALFCVIAGIRTYDRVKRVATS